MTGRDPHLPKDSMTKTFSRRRTLLAAAALTLVGHAWAQAPAWPTPGKPIRIVLPFPAGSGTDGNVRVIAKALQDQLGGHPVIVDNKPGAGTFIGAAEVARAAPDGHTLLYTIVITHTQNPHLYAKLPYDAMKDFTPLTQVMKSATVLVTQASAPYNNIAELVAYAKANPGKLNYASFSAGSTSHLNGELLQMRTGIQMVHVPYKGTPDATRALLAGDVQLYFDGTTTRHPADQGRQDEGAGHGHAEARAGAARRADHRRAGRARSRHRRLAGPVRPRQHGARPGRAGGRRCCARSSPRPRW
jgi:tripartite-type tricarboxylate transporter receptor subunit TctC